MLINGVISGDAGHNAYPDTGATGVKQEDILTKGLWLKVQTLLSQLGYKVIECTPYGQRFQNVSGSLGYRCKVANSSGATFHLCIHFNCGGGHGVEAYAVSSTGRQYAQQLCDAIAALGFANRGVKDGSSLFVLKYTNMPAVLLEVCFVDSQEDMNRYNEDAVATAIVNALTGKTINSNPVVTDPQQTSNVYDFRYLQHEVRTTEDNIPGPITLSKCPLIRQGATGNIVKWIQSRLNALEFNCGAVDGIFGSGTLRAIIQFQNSRELGADGIVGQNTWRKLLGL